MNISPSLLLFSLFLISNSTHSSKGVVDDWAAWGGPDRNGVSPEKGWSSQGAEHPLWSLDVGVGCSAASVARGRLYTRGFIAESGKHGKDVTLCLDALTGKQLWSHASPAELKGEMHDGGTLSTPVVDGDTVYAIGRMGSLWALSAEDGKLRWEQDLKQLGVEMGSFGLSSSPVVLGDKLIINVGKTVAYDKRSGKELWSTEDYGYSYGTPVAFSSDGKELLAVFNAEGLAVLSADSGEQMALHAWTSEYNINAATPIVMGDQIFISTGYNEKGCALLQYSESGLKQLWSSRSMNNLMNGCVSLDGHYYGFDSTKLKCLDAQGEELWSVRGLGRGTLIAADGRLIVISEKGELQIGKASPSGFKPEYSASVLKEGPCWTTPTLANGLIYCRSAKGQLVCLDHRAKG